MTEEKSKVSSSQLVRKIQVNFAASGVLTLSVWALYSIIEKPGLTPFKIPGYWLMGGAAFLVAARIGLHVLDTMESEDARAYPNVRTLVGLAFPIASVACLMVYTIKILMQAARVFGGAL